MRVAVVYDVDGWAHHRNALGLRSFQRTIDFTPMTNDYVAENTASVARSYDAVLAFTWIATADYGLGKKLISVVSSHSYSIRNDWKECLARGGGVLCISPRLHHELRTHGVESVLCYQGVDDVVFVPDPARARGGVRVCGWVGSDLHGDDQKGYRTIFENLRSALSPALEFRPLCRNYLNAYTIPEMVEYYRSIDVLLSTSRLEGGPLPPLEAMACGVPVLTTNVGCMDEVVRHGVDGFVVDRTCAAFTNYLRQVTPEMGESARANIEKRWSWRVLTPSWEAAIERFT